MGLTPRDHTRSVLNRMQLSGSVPGNLDRNKDAEGDNYGLTAAKSSDASSFKMTGAPKSPHLGRPGRQTGGRISGNLQRTRRTPQETAADIANEDKLADELGKDRGRAKGGRIGRDAGGPVQRTWGYAPPGDNWRQSMKDSMAADSARNADFESGMRMEDRSVDRTIGSDTGRPDTDRDRYIRQGNAKGGRVGRARGGRTAKGKTTVNVIIGGQKAAAPMPPPPMAAPGPVGPPRPPPMPPPGMGPGGPPGGAPPMGPGGPPPPPGVPPMPMRARGGRIEISTPGKHDYGKAGVKHGSTHEKYGGGSGLGRQERARHQK